MNDHESPLMRLGQANDFDPIKAWFLGPRCEQAGFFRELIEEIFQGAKGWRTAYTGGDKSLIKPSDITAHRAVHDDIRATVNELLIKLSFDFPFFSPHYIGHMLSETTIPAMVGYFAGMLRNSNNVTPEAAAATVKLELEVGKLLASMIGLNAHDSWAHLCSGGTIANLESLWAARAAQWLPVCLQEICRDERTRLEIDVVNPNGYSTPLSSTPVATLLHLGCTQSLKLADEVRQRICRTYHLSPAEWSQRLADCKSNPRTQGLHMALRAASCSIEQFRAQGGKEEDSDLQPVIFVSAAAHYSISKAAQILGYGERAVRKIPVDSQFRINVDDLASRLNALTSTEYVAAVIGIVGTTEEGAVDPVHEICKLRCTMEQSANRSFWIHLDAAWGGYFATLFNVRTEQGKSEWRSPNLTAVIEEPFVKTVEVERRTLGWNDQSVLEAFSSMRDADSITIDPHKTGYIPYPAGAVVFKDAHVRDLMTQRAQYIASEDVQPDAQESFAPFILEGSKPGAAAAACWVAHKAIPLDSQGHGLLMKECVLNAQRLAFYLKEYHRTRENSGRLGGRDIPIVPFAFVPICLPDTNVVTFVAVPTLSLPNGNIQPVTNQLGRDLNWLNTLNKAVHQELSITVKKDRNEKVTRTFFISQTEFSHQQYSAESLEDLLELIDVNQSEYREVGLLVLRATVMNPFYRHAKEEGEDLLLEFVKHLNQVVEQKLRENWT